VHLLAAEPAARVKQAVIITGLCRSGTSAVAEVCHVLGFPMGRTFGAPIAPDFRLDWEDGELTPWMADTVEERNATPYSIFGELAWFDIEAHVAVRVAHSHGAGCGGRLGFKSPLLAILHHERERLEARLSELGFYDRLLVWVTRSETAIERSIARQPGAEVLRRWNGLIHESSVPRNHVLPYEALVANPAFEVGRLASLLGVEDPVRISQAAARVARPCS